MRLGRSKAWMGTAVLLALWTAPVGAGTRESARGKPLDFNDVRAQAKEFIGYYHSIPLDGEQARLKERVLKTILAPCCSNYSIQTCCCPCNLAKTVWGLSNYAIARLGYGEAQLRTAVLDWLRAVGPGGFTGNACFRGGCFRSFAANGCGGMEERQIVF